VLTQVRTNQHNTFLSVRHFSIDPGFEVLFMKLYTVKSEGLSHNSYMLFDGEDAAVVDPRRDCQIYMHLARKNCAKICYILETHRNEDYVVGSRELQSLSNAQICHSNALPFKYGEHSLQDGETLNVGSLKIKAINTPGHTDESLCYTVSDPQKSAEPLTLFTGDTLFVGSVGRTDLQGKPQQPKQAEKLYGSLYQKVLLLGEDVVIYPAHGSGSVCGSGIGEQPFSTLGYEKKTNPYLKLEKEAFVQHCLRQELIVPAYFAKMETYNLSGAPQLRGLPTPKTLSVAEFEAAMAETDSVVVDTRQPNSFAGSHIANSLSIWLGGGTAVYPGWILGYDQRILFIVERKTDVARVSRHFWRLGFDNTYGFLCKGVGEWQEQGKPISHIHTISAAELQVNLSRYLVLDVREPSEWHEDGIIEGAQTVFFADLPQKEAQLSRNKRYAIICSVGKRSSIAASMLKRKDFEVTNVLGGMTAWKKLGYPTVTTKKEKPITAS
jgi:hydroxyacylglutathione hydrolase